MKSKQAYRSQCCCMNLRRAANAVTEFYDAALEGTGLSISQYSLLVNLERMESASTSDLAERVNLERSTLVRNLKPLLERELILDTAKAGARSHKFIVSAQGRLLLEKAKPLWDQAQACLSAYLGREDKETLLRLLRKLHELPR